MNEDDLTSAFAEIRAAVEPPPHGLTAPAMVEAGRRFRRRRRIGATVGGGLGVVVLAVAIGIGVVNAAPPGTHPPIQPGGPSPGTPTPSILPTPHSVQLTIAPTPTVDPTPGVDATP